MFFLGWLFVCIGGLLPLLQVRALANSPTVPRSALLIGSWSLLLIGYIWRSARLRTVTFSRAQGAVGLYLLVSILSIAWCRDRPAALTAAFELGALVSFAWGTASIVASERKFSRLLIGVNGLAALPVTAIALFQNSGGHLRAFPETFGPGGTFGNKNVLAFWMEPLFAGAFLLVLTGFSRRYRWGLATLAGLFLAMLVVTRSRGAWLASALTMIVAVLVLLCVAPSRRLCWRVIASWRPVVWSLVLGAGSAVLSGKIGSVRRGLVPPSLVNGAAASASVRWSYYANTLAAWKTKPWGWGLGAFRTAFCEYANQVVPIPASDYNLFTQPWDAHSDWIQLLLEVGPVGVGVFSLMLVTVGFQTVRSWTSLLVSDRLLALAIGAALTVTLVHAGVDYPLHRPASAMLWWEHLGILMGISAKSSQCWVWSWPNWVRWGVISIASTVAAAALWFSVMLVVTDRQLALADRALAQRNFVEARALLEPVVLRFPFHFLANRSYTRASYQVFVRTNDDVDRVRRAFALVLENEPYLPGANLMAATVELARHDRLAAKRYLDRAAHTLPDDPDVRRIALEIERTSDRPPDDVPRRP